MHRRRRGTWESWAAVLAALLACAPSSRAQTSSHAHHHHDTHAHVMPALYGDYGASREASGTAWQPEAAPHHGRHVMAGPWSVMLHGDATLTLDRQGGPRGDDDVFASNMVMGVASRGVGAGRVGARVMLSAEPATMGRHGYPLLLQTGETADGVTPLIDRQHPHDFLMEVAVTGAIADATRSLFLYAGLPGEPAIGPPAFMHRFPAVPHPEAPISHHWLDATHITFGVLSLGATAGPLKLEASAFRGREPDQERWNFEEPKLDSHAFRLSWNPTPHWALQASHGRLESPEQLEPEVDTDRTTASAMHAGEWGGHPWQTTVAWGRNRNRPGPTLEALLLESALEAWERHTLFARVERVEKNELFAPPDPRAEEVHVVGKLSAGWRIDLLRTPALRGGIGIAGTLSTVPSALDEAYDGLPGSLLLFTRLELR